MLDRLAVLAPSWNEPHAADIGNTLVDILAYAADHLSYRQDAVGTEAYLGVARSRISLRRHARLVDYTVNDGSNACVFVHFDVTAKVQQLPQGVLILPRVIGVPAQIDPDPQSLQFSTLLLASPAVFATMAPAALEPEQNSMPFYTWGDEACCLPAGRLRRRWPEASQPSKRIPCSCSRKSSVRTPAWLVTPTRRIAVSCV